MAAYSSLHVAHCCKRGWWCIRLLLVYVLLPASSAVASSNFLASATQHPQSSAAVSAVPLGDRFCTVRCSLAGADLLSVVPLRLSTAAAGEEENGHDERALRTPGGRWTTVADVQRLWRAAFRAARAPAYLDPMDLDPPQLRLLDPSAAHPSSGRQVVLPPERQLRSVFDVSGEGPFVLSGLRFVPPLSRVDVPLTSGDAGAGVAVDGMFVFARALEKSAETALTMRRVAERRRADQEGDGFRVGVEVIRQWREVPSRDRWRFDNGDHWRFDNGDLMMRALFIDESTHRVPMRWRARFMKGSLPCMNPFRRGAEGEGLEDIDTPIISPERGDDLPEASFLRAAVGGLPAFAEMLTPEGLWKALGTADSPAATITLRHLLEEGFGVRLPPRKEAASELLAVGGGETEALEDAAADEAGEEQTELLQLRPLTQAAAERAFPEYELDLGTAGTLAHVVEFESFGAPAGSDNQIEQQITVRLMLRSADARGVGAQEGRTPLRTQPEGGVVGEDSSDAPTSRIVIVAALTRRVDFGSLSSGGSGGTAGDEGTAFRLARIEVVDNSRRLSLFPDFLCPGVTEDVPRWGAQIEARAMIGAAVLVPWAELVAQGVHNDRTDWRVARRLTRPADW
eukprot:g15156.t1